MENTSSSQISVKAGHSPLAFIYELFKPTITVNGQPYQCAWGQHSFKVPSGNCEVSVSYPWFFSSECGKNTVHFTIQARNKERILSCRANSLCSRQNKRDLWQSDKLSVNTKQGINKEREAFMNQDTQVIVSLLSGLFGLSVARVAMHKREREIIDVCITD